MNSNLKNKKIELFVENSIDNYRKKEEISIREMLKVYFDSEGFFVLKDEKDKTIGYLDILDLFQLKKIIELLKKKDLNYSKDTVKDLKKKDLINFREDYINYDEKLIDVIEKLDNSEQTYFPVLKKGVLIGRVSKRIIREKLKELY